MYCQLGEYLQIKEQLAKANCSAGSPRGKGERLGTSLNEFWLSPIYSIDGIFSFIREELLLT
jgi:hypothetical protein